MGLGRKANKGDTSATSTSSDESSWMPSQVAVDLSNTALEVRSRPGQVTSQQLRCRSPHFCVSCSAQQAPARSATCSSPHSLPCSARAPGAPTPTHPSPPFQAAAQFSDVSDNRTQSWERSEVPGSPHTLASGPGTLRGSSWPHAAPSPAPQVTSEGKSSSDDAPSSVGPSEHHDDGKSKEIPEEEAAEELVAEVAAEEEMEGAEEVVAEKEDVAAEAGFRKHLEDVATEPLAISEGAEHNPAVQGVAQASGADAHAPDDEQDECAPTDDE